VNCFPGECSGGATCTYCSAIATTICAGPACANVSQCPPDHACLDASACFN
jgi:hypothetical protein